MIAPVHPSLFTPGRGLRPHCLAGRSHELAEFDFEVSLTPSRPRGMCLLLGLRGFGKTAMLREIEDRAALNGLHVVSEKADAPGFVDRLAAQLWDAAGSDAAARERHRRPWGIEDSSATASARPSWDFGRALSHLGATAQRNSTGVLVTLDDMHAGDLTEIVRMANDLQFAVRRDEPVVFVGAALTEARHMFLSDLRLAFFCRGAQIFVENVDRADVRLFLERTICDAGGAIDNEALDLLAAEAAGNPYRMQALGFHAWQHASAPRGPIRLDDAASAARQAAEVMRRNVFSVVWRSLSDDGRAVVKIVGRCGGSASVADVADALPLSAAEIDDVVRRLASVGALRRPGRGRLALGALMGHEFVETAEV